jgi:predicted DNA-binding ribbon-helix-helix protein
VSGRDVDNCVYIAYAAVMGDTTTVRIDRPTHDALKRLARERGSTVTETVAAAVRLLRQDRMGEELAHPLREDEHEWLDADLG